jgi:chemotaxis protein methyltransferase WspC
MSSSRFEDLLKDTMGLDVASVGSTMIERAVNERLRATGIANEDAYWEAVRSSGAELQRLIEAVVVPETWFFRDAGAFAALNRYARDEWLPSHGDGEMRVLSLPCSTGEEPYSIAMSLLDNGMPAVRFRVDGVDISEINLRHARAGVYRKTSFRADDLSFRDRYFAAAQDGHAIGQAVRDRVRFLQGNVLSPTFLSDGSTFDAIFCRNLLIYFDRETQAKIAMLLHRLLSVDGMLFVGAAESGIFLNTPFASAKMPMAFALRKASAAGERKPPAPPLALVPPSPLAPRKAATPPPSRPAPLRAVPAPVPARPPAAAPAATGMDEARTLADQGRFVEAARLCDDVVRRNGPQAEAFYLLGLVRDASGNHTEAVAQYRKALYLDPNHRESLAHLALLLDDQEKKEEAQALRRRMQRLEQRRKV